MDSNSGPSGNSQRSQTTADRWRKGGWREWATGRKSDDGSAVPDGGGCSQQHDSLREERLRMVIHQLYGTQAHYQAAQKFLKNRTLRKMNNNGGMTLYERIMAYRKLKEGEKAEEEQAAPAEEGGDQVPKNRPASARSDKNKSLEDSPVRRPTSSRNTPRPMDRSDTSFASVDISDLTALDEEKNRSPSPQPTFEDRPMQEKLDVQSSPEYEAQLTARDVDLQVNDTESTVITHRRAASAAEKSVVATAAVATVAHAHTSAASHSEDKTRTQEDLKHSEVQQSTTHKETYENIEVSEEKADNTEVHKEKSKTIESTEVHEEKYKNEETRKEKRTEEVKETGSEDVQDEEREETFESSVEKTATAVLITKAVSDSSQQKTDTKEIKKEEEKQEKSKRKERKSKEEKHESKEEHREDIKEEAIKAAVVAKAVSETSKDKEVSKEKQEKKTSKKESTKVSKSHKSEAEKIKSERSVSRSSKHEETSFIEDASATVTAAVAVASTSERSKSPATPAKTPEAPAKTPEAFTMEIASSPVAGAAPAATAAAAASPKPKKSKSRPKSSKKKDKNKEQENQSTIAALEKLADKNLNNLLGNGDDGEESEIDKEMLDKVFSPSFQAELDNFLRTT